jgi:hypothetical protein
MAPGEGYIPGNQVNYGPEQLRRGFGPHDLDIRSIHARAVNRFSRLWPEIYRVTELAGSPVLPVQIPPVVQRFSSWWIHVYQSRRDSQASF